jgi:hypothetical protein
LYGRPCLEQRANGLPARSRKDVAQDARLIDLVLAEFMLRPGPRIMADS